MLCYRDTLLRVAHRYLIHTRYVYAYDMCAICVSDAPGGKFNILSYINLTKRYMVNDMHLIRVSSHEMLHFCSFMHSIAELNVSGQCKPHFIEPGAKCYFLC